MSDQLISKLLSAILDWDSDCCYYDDDLEKEVIEGTEDDLYQYVMNRDEEIHFIGTDKIKGYIHLYFTNYHQFSLVCFEYKAY